MTLYLPDTHIFVYAFHGEKPYAQHVSDWMNEKSLLISAIVAAEFLSGGVELERQKFQALLDKFGTIPIDTAIARIAGDYKRQFEKVKPKFGLPDALIAATCKLYGCTLVTENKSDFRMRDIEVLTL